MTREIAIAEIKIASASRFLSSPKSIFMPSRRNFSDEFTVIILHFKPKESSSEPTGICRRRLTPTIYRAASGACQGHATPVSPECARKPVPGHVFRQGLSASELAANLQISGICMAFRSYVFQVQIITALFLDRQS